MNTLGKRLLYLRNKYSLSLKEAAKQVFIDYTTLSKYETDKLIPQIDIIISLSKLYEASTDWILMGESPSVHNTFHKESNEINKLVSSFSRLNKHNKKAILDNIDSLLLYQSQFN